MARGAAALSPWLMVVTMLQFLENLTDRRAAMLFAHELFRIPWVWN
jgi:hypothetical protein